MSRISVSDSDSSVCGCAALRLSDQDLLFKIAKQDSSILVRLAAMRKMISVDRLMEMLEQDPNPDVRANVYKTIENISAGDQNKVRKARKVLTIAGGGHKKCERCAESHKWWVAKTLLRSPLQDQFSGTSLSVNASNKPNSFAGACQKCEDVFCTDHAWEGVCLICESSLYS